MGVERRKKVQVRVLKVN